MDQTADALRRPWRRCTHQHSRCIHGDEGWARMKVFLRWWKDPIIRRQACLDCGAALDRDPICTQHPGRHTWVGPWTDGPRNTPGQEADRG